MNYYADIRKNELSYTNAGKNMFKIHCQVKRTKVVVKENM